MIDIYLSFEGDTPGLQLEAIMYANEALSVKEAREMGATLNSNVLERAMHDMVMADVFYYKNKTDSSRFYYEQMLYKAIEAKDTILADWGASNLSSVYSVMGNLAKALQIKKYYVSKLKINTEKDGTHYYNLGNIYLQLGQIDSATYFLQKTADIDRKNGNLRGLLFDLLAVIELNFRGEKFSEALSICDECIDLGKEINYTRGLAMCHYLKADVLRELGLNEEALLDIDQALEIDEERGDLSRLPLIYLIKGKILLALDRADAEEYLIKSVEVAKERSDPSAESSALLSLVNYHSNKGEFSQSENYLTEVKKLVDENNLARIKMEYLDAAYDLYSKEGSYKAANEVLAEKVSLLTSDNSELIASQAESIDQSYDLFRVESANERLAYEKEINELKSKRKNNLYLGIGIILLLTSLLWYYAYQNQKNRMANAEAESKERELRYYNDLLRKEMNNLRSQMNPHFLFNSLNSINDYVMHEDPKVASIYLTKFSRLMRTILNHSKKELISLEEELKAVNLYMELEKIRFKDRFTYEYQVDTSLNLENLLIPPMLIQPFLENAVKHGMKNLDRYGIINLQVNEREGRLAIVVTDNGVGRTRAADDKSENDIGRKSYGTQITSERIDLLNSIYNVNAELKYRDLSDPTGTEVTILLNPIKIQSRGWKALKQLS
ncbi:tetratricopeptide repeat-containing sensor histidine kinase [Portibacter marinus]|uniref:tetratricopeptide repeat-containing sensor histidine kinase n=1 Tax=Portibacter marinus TaxID=2898660 RepID=UPI001F3C952C|nr:histidine kinase [Portibacter marinus]